MKDYFNKEEQTAHIAVLSCQTMADKLAESEAITEEERKSLKTANKALKQFNQSVFDRLGEAYERRLLRTLDANKLVLVGKYEVARNAISYAAEEDLLPKIRELQQFNCLFCDKENHKDCAMYAMGVAVGLEEAKNYEGSGCPFKM